MRVELNGKAVDTQAVTLSGLIAERDVAASMVATAVNGEFVARDAREATRLTEGIRIEILSPMQGG